MKKIFLAIAIGFSGVLPAQQVAIDNRIEPAPNYVNVTIDQPDASLLKFKVTLKSTEPAMITINVIDTYFGAVINTRTITTTGYTLLYDLRELEDGAYKIEVKTGTEKIQRDINILTRTEEIRSASLGKAKREPARRLGF